MEAYEQEVINRVLEEDENFREAYKAHKKYENRLERIEKKPRLSPEEKLELKEIKKLKLALKDEMNKILAKYGSAAS